MMGKTTRDAATCQVCHQPVELRRLLPAEVVSGSLLDAVKSRQPDWSPDGHICVDCLNRLRAEHVQELLKDDNGELSALQREVVDSMNEQELLSKNVDRELQEQLTVGQRLADRMAEFGGSWPFIGSFFLVLFLWIGANTMLLRQPYDPYPFILLNLALSCIAAIQAPVIMMSQNRQSVRDRLHAENDYQVNLKAEIEVRALHAKLDLLLTHQWQRLLEIQQIQTEMMEDLAERRGK